MSHVTLSVSEAAFQTVFNRIPPSLGVPFDGAGPIGPVRFAVEAEIYVNKPGKVDFEDGDTFHLRELDIGWNKLILTLGIDIPTIPIGPFCLVRVPSESPIMAGKCLMRMPGIEFFFGSPDIGPIPIDLSPILQYVVTEVSGRFRLNLVSKGDKLAVRASAEAVDVDPISINDTFGKLPALLKVAVGSAVASFLTTMPHAWLADFALGKLGFPTVTDIVLDLLDISDDVEEWLMDVLNTSIGIDDLLTEAIANAIASHDVFELPDPFKFLPKRKLAVADHGGFEGPPPAGPTVELDPVRAPLANAASRFHADRLHISFDFGG